MGTFLSVYPSGYPQRVLGISPNDPIDTDDLFKNEDSGIYVALDIEYTGTKIAAVGLVAGECRQEGVFLKKSYVAFPVTKEDFTERVMTEFFSKYPKLYQRLLAHNTSEAEAAATINEFFDDLSLNNPTKKITLVSDNSEFDVAKVNQFLVQGGYRPYELSHMLRPAPVGEDGNPVGNNEPYYQWNGVTINPDNMYLAHLDNHHKKWGFASELFKKWGIPPVENPNPHDPVSDAETILNEFTRFRIHSRMIKVVGSRYFS